MARQYTVDDDEVMVSPPLLFSSSLPSLTPFLRNARPNSFSSCSPTKNLPDQITAELNDLIGSDYDESFTDWLFTTASSASNSAPQPSPSSGPTSQSQPQSTTSPADAQRIETFDETASRDRFNRGGASRGGRGGGPNGHLFGSAMSGVKRPFDDHRGGADRSQRPRGDYNGRGDRNGNGSHGGGPPTGPRHQPYGRRDDHRQGGRRNDNIFERTGMSNNDGMVPDPVDVQNQIDAVTNRGGPPNQHQQGGPFGQQQFPPGFYGFPPNGFPQGFPPQMQGMMPMFPGAFGPGGPMPGFGPQGMMPMNPNQNSNAQKGPVPLKPVDSQLCTFATTCKNAWCRYSHPSPAASKETGLVLSTDACEKQLLCEDAVRSVPSSSAFRGPMIELTYRTVPRVTFPLRLKILKTLGLKLSLRLASCPSLRPTPLPPPPPARCVAILPLSNVVV